MDTTSCLRTKTEMYVYTSELCTLKRDERQQYSFVGKYNSCTKTKLNKWHTPQPIAVSDILTWPYLTQCFKCRFTFICILTFWQLKYFIKGWNHNLNTWIQKKNYHNKRTRWNLSIDSYFSRLINYNKELQVILHSLMGQNVCLIIKKYKK